MLQFRRLIITLLLVSCAIGVKAQRSELALGVRAGHNATFGGFAAVSLETMQVINDSFEVSGGTQYNTIGKGAIEVRPSYLHGLPWGRLSVNMLLDYTRQSSINNFVAGAGVGLSSKWVDGKLGYYCRLYDGVGGRIVEPFNIYYELCANFLPMKELWDLQFIITNCEIFEIDRHYQPSFMVKGCYYPNDRLGVSLGVGCKPAGIFNISVGYYQSHVNLGVCYRW